MPPYKPQLPGTGAHTSPPQSTILLAEDQDQLRTMLTTVLQRRGYNVLASRDGREALELGSTPTVRIDVLISDVEMPGIEGPALADRLREFQPQMKVLLMSGSHSSAVVGGEVCEVLPKPFDLATLLGKVSLLFASAAESPGCDW